MIDAMSGASPLVEYRPLVTDTAVQVGDDGSVWSKKSGVWKQIKGRCNSRGYLVVEISRSRRTVHSLVLEAFVGPRPEGLLGLHANDVKTDNRLENLRWGTHRENAEDALRNGRVFALLGEENAREIVRLRAEGLRQVAIATRLSTTPNTVKQVLQGKLWSDVTGIPARHKLDFEGPKIAAGVMWLRTWGLDGDEIAGFMDLVPSRVVAIVEGRSYAYVTAPISAPIPTPVTRRTRSHEIADLSPEILRLHQEEGWSTKQLADRFGISLRKIQYLVA